MTKQKEYKIVGAILGAFIGYIAYSYFNGWQYDSGFELWHPSQALIFRNIFLFSPVILGVLGWYLGRRIGAYRETKAPLTVNPANQIPTSPAVVEAPNSKHYLLKIIVVIVALFFIASSIAQQASKKSLNEQITKAENDYKATLDENGRTPSQVLALDLQNNAHKIIENSFTKTFLPDKQAYKIDFETKGNRSGLYDLTFSYQAFEEQYLDIQFYKERLQLEPGNSKHSFLISLSSFEEYFRKTFPQFQGKDVLIDSTARSIYFGLIPVSDVPEADESFLGKYGSSKQISFPLRIKLLARGGYEIVPGQRSSPLESPDVKIY